MKLFENLCWNNFLTNTFSFTSLIAWRKCIYVFEDISNFRRLFRLQHNILIYLKHLNAGDSIFSQIYQPKKKKLSQIEIQLPWEKKIIKYKIWLCLSVSGWNLKWTYNDTNWIYAYIDDCNVFSINVFYILATK